MIHIFLASKSDTDHGAVISSFLSDFGVEAQTFIASAHKVPEKVVAKVEELNAQSEPTVIITCVGMSNGLSGVVAGSSIHPVIACPVFKDQTDYLTNIHSTLQMPSAVPVLATIHPKNAAFAALKILAESDPDLRAKIAKYIADIKSSY